MADVHVGFEAAIAPPATAAGWGDLTWLAGLANVAAWELRVPPGEVIWHSRVEHVLLEARALVLEGPAGRGPAGWHGTVNGRTVHAAEVGDALVAPLVEAARAGAAWDHYELLQELVATTGEVRKLLIRAAVVPDPRARRFLGIVADVSSPERLPWVTQDVAERLQLLVEHSPDGIAVHQDGRIVYANAAAARLAGVGSPEAALGKLMVSFLRPQDVEPVMSRVRHLRAPGDVAKGQEVVLQWADGTEVPVEVASVRTTWGGRPAYQVILHDLRERKFAEHAARARAAIERRHAAAVEALEEGVVVFDSTGMVTASNASARRILGTRLAAGRGDAVFTGGRAARRPSGTTYRPLELPVAVALDTGEAVSEVILGVQDDAGSDQWLSVNACPLGGEPTIDDAAVVCSVSDITERKQLVDRLSWEARHDPLTGLANRSGFLSAVQDAADCGAGRLGLALFFFDLDRFKLVNDSLGHALGDEVLLAMAERLQDAMPHAVCLSRLHGDEFAALEVAIPDADAAMQRAEELRTVLTRPMRLSTGRTLSVTPSVGVVHIDPMTSGEDRPIDAAGLLQDADMAMLQAKARGRCRVALFDASVRDEISGRLELEDDLRQAVAHGELRLEYQPLASLANGRVLGLEALIRWEHPRQGLLLPARFVALAEESELIVGLGEWVLQAGCEQLARWRALHPEAQESFLAINVSPRQLEGFDLLGVLRDVLDATSLPAGALVLEITESGLVADDPGIQAMLRELRQFGVRLAIDDFGTGYSSLSYLKRLPVSFLKVDRSFVSGLGVDAEDERIVAAVVELAHGLGLRVIAEGVENRQQRHMARQLGCDLYQGYFLAKPLRPRDVPALWRGRPRTSADGAGR